MAKIKVNRYVFSLSDNFRRLDIVNNETIIAVSDDIVKMRILDSMSIGMVAYE